MVHHRSLSNPLRHYCLIECCGRIKILLKCHTYMLKFEIFSSFYNFIKVLGLRVIPHKKTKSIGILHLLQHIFILFFFFSKRQGMLGILTLTTKYICIFFLFALLCFIKALFECASKSYFLPFKCWKMPF